MNDSWQTALIDGEQAGRAYSLQPPRRAMRGQTGVRAGTLSGVSLDFSDYREYHPGDDLRSLDWSVYARSDKLTVKLYHEEISPHVDLLLDMSSSMDLPDTRKAEATLGAAALMSSAADNAGCSRSVWKLTDRVEPFPEGRQAPSRWNQTDFTASPSAQALAGGFGSWRPLGMRILISDLMWETDPVRILRTVAEKAALVIVVQVLADEELSPPAPGRYRLEDVETGNNFDLRLDAGISQRYLDLLSEHRLSWETACRQVGAVFVQVSDRELLSTWRLPELEKMGILSFV